MLHVIYKGDVVAAETCPAGEPDVKALQLARVKGRDGSYSIVLFDSAESLKQYTDAFADPNVATAGERQQPNDIEWLKKQLAALQAELESTKKKPAGKKNGKKEVAA